MSAQPFPLCLNTSTIRCGEIALPEMIAAASEAGYDAIEPWIKEIDAWTAAGGSLGDLKRQCDEGGLAVANLIGFFEWAVDDPAARAKAMEEARRGFEIAAALGAPFLAAPPMGLKENPPGYRAIAARYAELFDLGASFGVVPLIEYWGMSPTLGTPGEALLVAADCGRPGARILADVFHTWKSLGRFEGFRILGSDTLGLFHLNDYPATPARAESRDEHRVYPGDGVAPLPEILRALHAAGYRGPLSLELFNRDYWAQDAKTVARTGIEKTRRVLEEVFAT
ncbi:MAG: sugar phosphate isomerase/epimerase [Puniceicoccaceae bacterium]|nr:MAG: sugar phosphate isomerase/epimerase [Puniceicoccaceae bacterium]